MKQFRWQLFHLLPATTQSEGMVQLSEERILTFYGYNFEIFTSIRVFPSPTIRNDLKQGILIINVLVSLTVFIFPASIADSMGRSRKYQSPPTTLNTSVRSDGKWNIAELELLNIYYPVLSSKVFTHLCRGLFILPTTNPFSHRQNVTSISVISIFTGKVQTSFIPYFHQFRHLHAGLSMPHTEGHTELLALISAGGDELRGYI